MKKDYLLIAILNTINKPDFFLHKLKKTGILNMFLFLLGLFLSTNSKAQTFNTFDIRYATELKGDMLVVGNNLLGKNNNSLNDNTTNESVSMQYIDIDSDASTFNSSSADLAVPSNVDCFKIAYAGLYWGALIKTGDSRTDIDKIKFKTPGSSAYTDVTGELIYDANAAPIVPDANKPYACYANVTSIISGLTNPQGTYTVANVKSSTGLNGSTGLAAGWTLYVIYENPKTTAKYMVSYDGFSALYDGRTLDIPISGFRTPSSGSINIKFGFATLNGDKSTNNSNKTKVEISNGTANGTSLTTTLRPSNYFFNSSITNLDSYITSRNPNGTNSLGYDTGLEQLLNVNQSTIGNNATSAQITLQVARGQANPIFSFFNAFQVNVIAPDISLTKIVKDISGNDIGNTNVALGTNLYYEIGFQSSGNDNVTNFTLKDVLPKNVTFNYPSDIISLPTGVTHTYNATTRQLIFTIPDNLVEIGDVSQTIRLHVQVVSNYKDLQDACSNEIKNQAFASYRGVINTTPIVDEGSFASTVCNFGTPTSTNFLVNISGQTFSSNAVLCGSSVQLSGPDGYTSYSWSTSPTGTPVIGTNQTYTATQTGTYYIISTSPCATVTEAITVKPFGNTITNPVIPYADEVVVCPNNGKDLPNIFLCGANATRFIQTNISDASTIVWAKLNESSCAAITTPNCANESTSCQWTTVGTGPDYTANTSGQFRVTINYPGGCYSIFYFNVYQNVLNPTATTRDIICTKNGEITIGGVPSGYEYSLNGTTYQSSNVFSISTAGTYTVYIRQVGVTTNPCIFSVTNILIRKRNFTTSTIVTQPLCYGDKGAIKIGAQDAYPQYYYSLYQGATLVNSVGPISASDYEFASLNPGTYTVRVWTDDGCDYSTNIDIIQPPLLSATSALTKPLTCTDGEITIYPSGGTPPYAYYINGSTSSQSTPQITVSSAGTYSIQIVDSQNCSTTTSITVAAVSAPVFTISKTDVKCYNDNTGAINFNVTNANGYTLTYSINNGSTYSTNPTFSNLTAGTYNAIVKYSLAGTDCFTTAQTITITQPAAALTATASITELAGCGSSGEGKISITNPLGGTAPYQYSFDNQSTWSTTNEAYKSPGTYTVYIKDANGCIYSMPNLIIAPPPVTPTISVSNPTYNCDGTVSTTITVTTVANANYSYQYLVDGTANTNVPANVFTNLSSGNHTISVKYISTTAALACIPQTDFVVNIPTGNPFSANITTSQNLSCSSPNDGKITIAATNFDTTNGYQYSINNGTTWYTVTTSPYTITGLAAATYNLKIRYGATSGNTCEQSFTATITAPAPLITTANISSPASCSAGATISASSTGGTPTYRYELWNATATTNIVASQTLGTFTNVNPGNYIVRGYDANNCTDDSNIITVVAPPTLSATLDPSTDFCYDSLNQATLIVNTTGGTAPFVYSLDGAPAQNSNTFTNVTPGTHQIIVTDSYNCTSTISNIIIAPQLQLTATLSQDLSCLVNATINTTVSGGYGNPYIYTVSHNGGAATTATFPYTATAAGTYVFTVTDTKGCMATSNSITVSPKTTPTLTFTKTDISCNNVNDGIITVTASNGFTSAYTYAIKLNSSTVYTTQTTNQFIALPAGTYNIKVIDSKGCESAVSDVTIINPPVITGNISATDIQCSSSGTVTAVVTVTALGGTGSSYKYSFNGTSNFTNTNTFSTATAGIVTAYIQDTNGCQIGPLSVTIGALEPITDITIVDNGYDCSTTPPGGQVTLTAVKAGAANPISYQIISGPAGYNTTANSSGIFQGLAGGSYIFQATDTKTNCLFTKSYTITGIPAITTGGSVITAIKCFGDTGNIEYTVSGVSTSGYDYVIKNSANTTVASNTNQTATTVNLNNVIADSYTITVTDRKTNCTASYTLTLNQPSAALNIFSATATNVNCNIDNSQITITATGGTPNYSYAAVISGQTAPIATAYTNNNIITVDTNSSANLVWDVYVKDVNGCTEKTTVTVISDPMPAITSVVVNNQCTASGSNFTITATGTAGVAPLTYGIGGATGSFQSSNTFSVVPGIYTVWVKDANGCTAPASAAITVYPQLTASSAVTKTLDCSASPEAVITTTISGGKAPYTYTVQKGAGATSASSTAAASFTYNVSNANADTYNFVITDANGCTFTTTATVNPITNPTVTATPIQISCNGGTNGAVSLTGSGGSGGYTYSFDSSLFTSTTSYTGLKAGIAYPYQVKDSNGCVSVSATITLTEPTALVVSASATNFSCSATNAKQAAVVTIDVPTTGTAPYTYSFNGGGFTSTNTLTVNDNGTDQTINYSVKDANGCIQTGTAIIINRLNPPTAGTITNSAVTCTGTATTSTVTVTPAAGTGVGALTYEITFPASAAILNTTGVFNGLAPDTYIFKVTDANGCYYTQSITVNPVTPIATIATKLTDVDCFGNTTGSIRYNVSGFTTYSYSVNGGTAVTGQTAATFTLANLAAGTYNVVFTDQTTGCTTSTSTTITQPAAALTATYTTVNANCFTPTSKVTVTPSGGTSAYTYSFVADKAPAGTYTSSNTANLDPALVWDVWVKDVNGCTFKLDIIIAKDSNPTVTASATGQCLGTGSYTITANGIGTGTLNYSINNGASYQSGNTFVVTASGNYTIRVKDANGCTADSNTIIVAPQLTASAVVNKDITCNPAPTEAQITITATGGTAPFTYESKEASGSYTTMASNVFNSNVAGSYTFRITDANGCSALTTTPIVTSTPVNPDITVTQTASINCNGESTAAISVAVDNTKGQSPFIFNIKQYSDLAHTSLIKDFNTQTSGLPAGYYVVTVTDSKGCTDTENITITEPLPLSYTYTKNEIICNGSGTTLGSIIATPTGGTAPYTYTITNNVGATVNLTNLSGGVYTFDIANFGIYELSFIDANGCSQKQVITMASSPTDLTINVNNGTPTCTTSTIEVTVNPPIAGGPYHFALFPIISGSTPPYEYASNTGSYQNADAGFPLSSTFTGLNPGVIYSFIVYDEATNCYYFKQAESPTLTSSTLTSTVTPHNVKCKGDDNGTVDFTFTNTYPVSTDVSYQIFNSQTNLPTAIPIGITTGLNGTVTIPINDLGPLGTGTYYILFKEISSGANNGCTNASTTFTISESPVDLNITATKIKTVNCKEDGVIAAQAQGGTAPYTYQYLLSSVTPPTASTPGWTSNTTFATNTTGNYTVYVKDAYGCIKTDNVTLDADDAPTVIPPATPICYDGSTPFTITFSGTTDPDITGNATYSVNGSAFQSSPSFTFNAAGTYNLVIKDGNGCTANVDFEVYPKLNLSATLTKSLDCTSSPDAIITLTPTGGNTTLSSNYTYEVNFNGTGYVAATNPYPATSAGNYIFRVTDANNATLCQTTTSFDLDPIPTTLFTTTETNVSCNTGTDGTITVNVTSGVGPYKYSLDGGVTETTNNFFSGLAAGNYVVTVRDAGNCTQNSGSIPIAEPNTLSATSTITTALSCGAGNVAQPATVTVNGVAGTAPYQYSFDGGMDYSSTNTYQSYTGTTFDVYVKDANGCTFILTDGVDIPALDRPTDMTFNIPSPATCLADATVEITGVTGGVGPLQFETISPSPIIVGPQTTTTFTGLTPGTYLFQVTDANGCTYQEAYTVDPVTNITVSGQLISDVSCNETPPFANGAVTFTVENTKIAGAFTYTLLQGSGGTIVQSANAVTLTNLGIGTYEIEVTDNTTGCKAKASAVVSQPITPLTLTEFSNINANCNSGAKVTVLANGGTPNYTYAFVADNVLPTTTDYTASASATLAFTAPAPNYYDVWVKDNNGCTYKLDIQINADASPIIAMPASQCFAGSPLTIDLAVGQTVLKLPASYTINGSNQTSSIYTINAPGTYQLSIVDANGCTSNTVNYVVQPQLVLDAVLTQDLTCAVNANITLTATGGIAPYVKYEVNDGSGYVVTTNPFTTATAGTYKFRVTDTQGCQAESQDMIVTPKTTPTATFTPTNVSCIGGSDGTITITAANGIAPYQYSINNGGTYQSSNIFIGLTNAGVYNIVVKDAKECPSVAIPVDITDPTPVSASAAVTPFGCNASNVPQDAIVTITAAGGTPGYTYSFDGGTTFQSSASFTVNTAKTINYFVHDANGCSTNGSAIVLPYSPPTDMNLTASPIYCNTIPTVATVTVNSVTAGVAPYTYEIISPASAVTAPTATNSFPNLTPNTYVIKVTDANGCSTTKAIEVKEANKISVTSQLVNNVFCKGGATGAINFMVSNYITASNYTYNLAPAAGTPSQTGDVINYTGLTAGTYTFTVTDGVSGCQASVVNFAISEPAIALNSSSVATDINCNNDNAIITITANGGTAPYQYAIARATDPAPTTGFVTANQLVVDTNNGTDINWIVYVKDTNGCNANNPQTISLDANPVITNVTATQCPNTTDGTYDITVTAAGTGLLQYSINGTSFQSSNIIKVNAAGNYNVIVKDTYGCLSAPSSVTILQPLTLTALITKVPTCNNADGEVSLTATGGTIPAAYEYSKDGLTYVPGNVFTALMPNTYTFYVRDTGTNCVKNINFTIEQATSITALTLTPTAVSCNGGNDGSITATIATPSPGVNDNPVYMYSLSGTATRPAQTSTVFSNLTAGNYTVTVTSGRGCTAIQTIAITEPAPIVVPTPALVQFGCNPGSNATNFATITVNGVTGGSGIYNYEFIKGGTRVQFGTNNTYTEADLLGGNYTVNVYDDKACMGAAPATITINPYIALDKITVTVNNAITCANFEDITVSVSSTGGTPASLQYTLVDVSGAIVFPPNTNGIFSGLAVGEYILTVTNPTTGCSIQEVHYVNEPNTFDLNINNTVDVSCYGGTNGSVNITFIDRVSTPTNDAGSFSYTITGPVGSNGISPTAGPFTISNLAAGTYTITTTLTNSPYCSITKNFTISQPSAALNVKETHTEITCISGNNDGSISATATGGWPGGYQYELVGPVNVAYSAQSNFRNLTAGNYTVNVKDSKGCIASANVTLVVPTPISITASANTPMLNCFGDKNAAITVNTTTGGQGANYSYTLNTISLTPATSSGPQTSPVFSGLGAGTYTITVIDGYSCSGTTTPIIIREPSKVDASLVVTSTQTCNNPTTLTLSATGGTGNYTYSADAAFTTVLGSFATSVNIQVPPGTYAYYVRDTNGCISIISNQIKIDPLPTLQINVDISNAVINCAGDNTGVIVATAEGGLGNYSYTLMDGSGATIQGPTASGNFTGLFAGNYQIKVDSGDCSTSSSTITITQPSLALTATYVITPVSCNGANNGIFTVNASGGTGIIKYAISPNLNQFFDSNIFDNLAPGNYNVIVQDELGCYIKINFDMTEPDPIRATTIASSIIPEICYGDKDGAFSVDISGGVLPYSVNLDNPTGTYTTGMATQTQFDFTGLTGGKHTVYILDANGCSFEWEVIMDESVKINPIALVDYGCINNSASNSVTVTVDSSLTNSSELDYSLDGGAYQSSNVFTNVPAGTDHYIDVRHTNGCIKRTAEFDILQFDPLTLSIADGGLNEIIATAAGGGGGYQFIFNGEDNGTKNSYIIYKSGDYTVQVTDANGCMASATRYFEFIDVCIPNYFTPNGDGVNDGWAPGCTENYKDLTFDIFDRYGRKIATYHLGQKWDGKYNGNELPSGDYWYVLKLNNIKYNREFVGHFTLYR